MLHLIEFCLSDTQRKVVELAAEGLTKRQIGEKLGLAERLVFKRLQQVKTRAAMAGVAPEADLNYRTPIGFNLKGTSTLINKATGETMLQWVKTDANKEAQEELMRDCVEALKEELTPYEPVAKKTTKEAQNATLKDLMSVYVITDYHLSMKADGEETGDDWDLKISEKLLVDWFSKAIELAPNSSVATFAQLGDLLHTDGFDALTPQSKHLLDADTRFQKTIRAAIRVVRHVINMLLKKHDFVNVLMCVGNHDIASSAWLRELFAVVYENEPRVKIDNSLDSYYCIEHGDTSLFFHHGHKRNMGNIDDVFVAKFRDIFGRTKHSYAHMGHYHHNKLNETNLMQIEQHRTLAPKDAYASHGGWMAGRDAKVITYHRRWGEISRLVIPPGMCND